MRAKISALFLALVFSSACSHTHAPSTPSPDAPTIHRPDDSPDYLETYNDRLPQISPDKNAYTYIFRAIGVSNLQQQREMIAFLRLPPFPNDTQFLQSLSKYELAQHPASKDHPIDLEHDSAWQLQSRMEKKLLTSADEPLVAQWLDAQSQPIKLLELAARQDLCVIPLCPQNDDHWIIDAISLTTNLMQSVQPFCARANLRAARGDFTGTQQDLATALRLARLIQQTPLLLTRLMGAASEMHICKTARIIALAAPMSPAELRSLAQALDQVPPAPTLANTYDFGERLANLDLYSQLARGKGAHLLRLDLMIFDNSAPIDEGDLNQVDWKILQRSVNENADRSAKIFASRDWRKIRKDLGTVAAAEPAPADIPVFPAYDLFTTVPKGEVDFAKKWEDERKAVLAFFRKRPGESREQFTVRIKQLFAGPPAMNDHFTNLFISRAIEFPLTQTTIALAAYRTDHHAWPSSLGALVPEYLPAIPEDPFSDNPLLYRTTRDGFLLHSVGPNGIDDSGQLNTQTSQEDSAVTFPLPSPTAIPASAK